MTLLPIQPTKNSSFRASCSATGTINQVTLVVGLFLIISFVSQGQDTTNKAASKPSISQQQPDTNRSVSSYQTSITGWVIHPGDTLQLGQGSLPTRAFAFLYQNDSVRTNSPTGHKALGTQHAGRKVRLARLRFVDPNEAGGRVYGLVETGNSPLYYAELDSAINRGEILPPIRYRPSAQASPAVPVRTANELIRLKALFDAKTITEAEYNRRKERILRKK